MLKKILVFLLVCLTTTSVYANPEGGVVAAGAVTFSSPDANTVQVNQTTDKAIVNWQSFNINANETTRFVQPNASSVILNRIDPNQGASQIYGQIQANGQVILVNQAGIYFGPGSRVDVAGMIASTSDISNDKFLSGSYVFDQKSPMYNGSIVNKGTIIAANHGLVALVGSAVSNEGTIQAHLGSIVLASGNKFTVGFDNTGLVNFTVDEATSQAGVDHNGKALKNGVNNSGTVIADGGTVLMAAKSVEGVMDNVINMTGIAQTQSVAEQNGTIIFAGDDEGITYISGSVDASGLQAGQTGGVVKVLGNYIYLDKDANINVSGDAGGGQIFVGGNYQGHGPLQNASTTYVARDVNLYADAINQGNGGQIIAWADVATGFQGNLSAHGGAQSGNGGFAEVSGKQYLNIDNLTADLSAPHGNVGTLLLDPANVTLSNSVDLNVSFSGGTYTPTTNTNSNIQITGATGINMRLGAGNIIISATQTLGGNDGDITVQNPISWSSSNSLTLIAANDITINPNTGITNADTGSIIMNSGHNILIGKNSIISTSSSSATSDGISLNAAGTITSASGITVNGDGFISFTAPGGVHLSADIATNGGDITFNSPFILDSDVNINASGGNTTFNSTIDGSGVRVLNLSTVNTGVNTFNGVVDNVKSLTVLGDTHINTTSISTNDAQDFNADVIFNGSGPTTLTSYNGAGIVLSRTASGPQGLIIGANSGSLTIGSSDITPLASLYVNAGNYTLINTINNFTTTGSQTYLGNLIFASDTILSTTNSPIYIGGDVSGFGETAVTFNSGSANFTVNGTMNSGLGALTINNTGTTTLGAAISAASLTTDAGGTTIIQAPVITTGTQTYNDALVLANSLTLVGAGITLNGVSGHYSLVLNDSLTSTVNGPVTGLYNFTTNAVNLFTNVASDFQTYNGDLTLGANVTLTGDQAYISNVIGNNYSLVSDNTYTILTGAVSGLSSLQTNDAYIASSIDTIGSQSYGAMTLLAPAVLTSDAGNIVINGVLDGTGQTLTLAGGAGGNHIFTINDITALDALTVNGNAAVTNTLNLNTGTTNNWMLTTNGGVAGSNGTVATDNVTSAAYNNIQNITSGASTNNFELASAAGISGNLIGKSGGTNTITIDDGSPNWIISGTDAGSVTGRIGGFSNVENLVGSSTGANTFIFTGNGTMSGLIDGGNTAFMNTLDFTNANEAITIPLAVPTLGSEFNSGDIDYGTGTSSFINIQQAIGNGGMVNYLVLPTNKSNISVTYTNAAHTSGSVGDPFYFINFHLLNAPPEPVPTPTPMPMPGSPTVNVADIAQIITPFTQSTSTDNDVVLVPAVQQNIDLILNQESMIDSELANTLSVGCFNIN